MTEPLWAIVFRIWADTPIYHKLGDRPDTTACGRQIGLHTPFLPMKHLKLIGRPCKGCSAK